MLLNAKKVAELKKKSEESGSVTKMKYKVDLPQRMKIKSVEGEVNKNQNNVLKVQFEDAKAPNNHSIVYKFYYVDNEVGMGQVVNLITKGFQGEVKPARDISELTSQVKKFVGKELKVALRLKPSFFKKTEDDGTIKAFSSFNYDLWYVGHKNDENFGVDSSKVVLMPDSYYNQKVEEFQEEYNDIEIQYTNSEKYFSTYVEDQEEKSEESSSAVEESNDLLSQSNIDSTVESDEEENDDLPF